MTDISHARLLAIAILLRRFPAKEEAALLDLWEKTSFRIYGLCRKDKRTAVGDYVRLAWETCKKQLSPEVIAERINKLSYGTEHDIDWAVAHLVGENCYEGWEDELLYLLYRYEESLAKQQGQNFSNEAWNRIWEASSTSSIEHITPQGKGSLKYSGSDSEEIYVHRLGNLLPLPPGLNSELGNKDPEHKAERYTQSGLLCAQEVAKTIETSGWNTKTVDEREKKLLKWIAETWA